MKPARLLQPSHFGKFRCIGSDCEDTCCSGWIVHIDKSTYGKYRNSSDPALQTLVTINENAPDDDDYARIQMNRAVCPFLSEGLCSIQQRFGEDYLSNMCATYPRVINRVDDVVQRSLDLSCPEAARIVLLNPQPIEFDEEEYTDGAIRPGELASLDTSGLKGCPEPFRLFREIRRLVLSVLQNRSYPVWKRLFRLGYLCETLEEARQRRWAIDSLGAIRKYTDSLNDGGMDHLADRCAAHSTAQLETVVELILDRIGSDSTSPRFLDCYREFMEGIRWTAISTLDEIANRHREAYSQHYAGFMSRHEYILEHYLVNYAYRTLFPLGLPESNQRLRNRQAPSPIAGRYMLMTAYFGITQAVLIGMAAFHKSEFGSSQVIRLIQSCSKTFEHSVTYPGRVVETLARKAMTTPESLCVLIRN
jgi:lysine-N-methylase